jgi:hypothetical protein
MRFLPILVFVSILFSGCLVSPVSKSGGIGAVTVTNSNPSSILSAAQSAFAGSGYTLARIDYPDSASFDKPSGTFGRALYGSYGTTTSVRATLEIIPIPGTNNYRLGTQVSRVTDAGQAGFEDSVGMWGIWSAEFTPILKQIKAEADNAGAY